MTKKIRMLLTVVLTIVLAAGFASATEIGKATITTYTIQSSSLKAAQINPLPARLPKVSRELQAAINPYVSFSPKKNSFGDSLFTSSLVTLTALNVADYFSTRQALKIPGLAEGNPFMKPFTKNALLFAGVKLGMTALDYVILKNVYKKNKVLGWAVSIAANVAMSYVVSNNIRLVQQSRGM